MSLDDPKNDVLFADVEDTFMHDFHDDFYAHEGVERQDIGVPPISDMSLHSIHPLDAVPGQLYAFQSHVPSHGMRRAHTSPDSLMDLEEKLEMETKHAHIASPLLGGHSIPFHPPSFSLDSEHESLSQSFPDVHSIPTAAYRSHPSLTSLSLQQPLIPPVHTDTKIRRIKSFPSMMSEGSTDITDRKSKKALSSRESRRKKKAYIQSLEGEVERLTQKLTLLENGSSEAKARSRELYQEEQAKMKQDLLHVVQNQGDVCKISEIIDRIVESARSRNETAKGHLNSSIACLMPGLQVKFVLWGLSQQPGFLEHVGFWDNVMTKEVGLDSEQIEKLKQLNGTVKPTLEALANLRSQMDELKSAVEGHIKLRREFIDRLRQVVGDAQVAKFILWVENNPLCMQMLKAVWKK